MAHLRQVWIQRIRKSKVIRMNDFTITPCRPDGIKVSVNFVVDTWEELYDLMTKLDEIKGDE